MCCSCYLQVSDAVYSEVNIKHIVSNILLFSNTHLPKQSPLTAVCWMWSLLSHHSEWKSINTAHIWLHNSSLLFSNETRWTFRGYREEYNSSMIWPDHEKCIHLTLRWCYQIWSWIINQNLRYVSTVWQTLTPCIKYKSSFIVLIYCVYWTMCAWG